MASSTVENYLKHIYLQQQRAPGELVSMGKLAAAMGVVPGTATTMVKALADSDLVRYEPRSGLKLTRGGEQLALDVLRRHRLLELFLVKVLGLDWSEVHAEAEELEHAISDKVLQRIDSCLNHPSVDPHGDPIPPAKGRPPETHLKSLARCAPGDTVRIARVVDQAEAFLRFLHRCGLKPGVTATVQSQDPLADAITLHPQGKPTVTLGTAAADKILVETEETGFSLPRLART